MNVRIFLLFFVLASFIASSASAQGLMIPRDPQHTVFELRSYEVSAEIQDHAAVTKVTQTFYNPGDRPAEAIFYFPVPKGATTTDFALWMNGERVRGEVLPRQQARAIYEGIVQRMRDPGLLEYVDSELFQASIFPVPPRGEQQVEIQYAMALPEQNGALHYRLPINERVARAGVKVAVAGRIESSVPITRLYSPSASVELVQRDPQQARFSFEGDGAALPRSVELFITRSTEELSYSLLTWAGEERNEDGYFMLTLAPGASSASLDRLPKQVTFVLDTSGSMQGEKWTQAVEALKQGIQSLHTDDRFNIVAFSSDVRTSFDRPLQANRRGKDQGVDYVESLFPRGGTNISGALDAALLQPEERGRPHTILFLTDGQPTEGITLVPDLLKHSERKLESDARRLFVFGVGYDVNTRLLDTLAEKGRGRSDYVRPNESIGDKFGTLMERIGAPLLTNLQVTIDGIRVRDVYPTVIPDLYQGESVSIFGRYASSGRGEIRLRARSGEEPFRKNWTARFGDTEGDSMRFVGNLWANRRVAELLKRIDEKTSASLEEELVALAIRWNIVTPYTSYLAVDPSEQVEPSPVRPPIGHPRPMPMIRASGGGAANVHAESAPAARYAAPQAMADHGQAAVERSLATRALEDAEVLAPVTQHSAQVQVIAGRRFELKGQIWVEEGVGDAVDTRVSYLSDAWLTLQRNSPEVRRILALGEKVRFRHQRKIIEVSP